MDSNDNNIFDLRLFLSSFGIIFLFFLINLFTWHFKTSVSYFLVSNGISYSVVDFFKSIFISLISILVIFLTGYNPLKWSKNILLSQRKTNEKKYRESRMVSFILCFFLLIYYLINIVYSQSNFSFKLFYLSNKDYYTPLFIARLFINAFYEELLFKGMLYRSLLKSKLPKYLIMIIVSIVFSISHIFVHGFENMALLIYFTLIVSSLYSLCIFNFYPSIWLLTVFHAIRNFLAYQIQ